MPKKSIWESNTWKTVIAISVIATIGSFLLQLSGQVDFWNILILPIINFFNYSVPLYSIPLSFLAGFVFLIILARTGGSNSGSISNPFSRAGILDDGSVAYLAILCKTPRTANFLKKEYNEFREKHRITGGYYSNEILKEMENRGLLLFQNEKWEITSKSTEYLKKYHDI